MRAIGILGIVIGGIWAIVAFNIDTSVSSGFGRVNNMGLMAEKQNHLMMSAAVLIISVLLFVFGKRSAKVAETEAGPGTRACPFCAELIKVEAIKCKHCGSDIPQDIAEIPPIGDFFEKPDGMSIGEYQEKISERYGVARLANGYQWREQSFCSFQELISAIKTAS